MGRVFRKYDPEGKRFDPRNPQSRVIQEKKEREKLERMYGPNVWNLLNEQTKEFNKLRKLAIVSPDAARRSRPFPPNPLRRPLLVYNMDEEESEQSATPVKPTDVTKRKLRLD